MGTRLSDSEQYAHLWGTPELEEILGERARLASWVTILIALARAQARLGIIPQDAAEIWANEAPHGTTTRPPSTSLWLSSRQHLARTAPVPPLLFHGQMSTCGARSP